MWCCPEVYYRAYSVPTVHFLWFILIYYFKKVNMYHYADDTPLYLAFMLNDLTELTLVFSFAIKGLMLKYLLKFNPYTLKFLSLIRPYKTSDLACFCSNRM